MPVIAKEPETLYFFTNPGELRRLASEMEAKIATLKLCDSCTTHRFGEDTLLLLCWDQTKPVPVAARPTLLQHLLARNMRVRVSLQSLEGSELAAVTRVANQTLTSYSRSDLELSARQLLDDLVGSWDAVPESSLRTAFLAVLDAAGVEVAETEAYIHFVRKEPRDTIASVDKANGKEDWCNWHHSKQYELIRLFLSNRGAM